MFKTIVIFTSIICLTLGCLIINCPRGGKRSIDLIPEKYIPQCRSCGPYNQGQCFGPRICCGIKIGCFVGTAETYGCRKESLYTRRCHAGFGDCKEDIGRCAANETCCSQGKPATTSNGSGFIVKEDGLILTNAHVVINKPNTLVKVRLQDGTTYTGTIEHVDMQSDLATVRIDKKNLPVMKLGSSSSIRPGEFVVAIGSPLSLSNTITSGVVSSVNRASKELGLHNKNMGYIQTDAAITFGNSGGPLVNLSGEAIGINAMKVTAGISFAIPIDYAKEFLKKAELQRKNKGMKNSLEYTSRRYMGVTMLTLTPDILFELQQRNNNIPLSVRHGVLVWKVMIGSPAYAGGLKAGDIVTHVNDEPVIAATSIYKVLEKAGSLYLNVLRNGQVLQVKIEPEDV